MPGAGPGPVRRADRAASPGKTTAQGAVEGRPQSSALTKLASRPKKSPIGAAAATASPTRATSEPVRQAEEHHAGEDPEQPAVERHAAAPDREDLRRVRREIAPAGRRARSRAARRGSRRGSSRSAGRPPAPAASPARRPRARAGRRARRRSASRAAGRRCRRARTSGSRARSRRGGARPGPGRCRETAGRRASRLRSAAAPLPVGCRRCQARALAPQGGLRPITAQATAGEVMEYRYLGRSGLKVSVLTHGHDDLRRRRRVRQGRDDRPRRGAAADRHVPRRRGEPDRHRQRLFGGRLRGDHRRGARRQAQGRRADRLQGPDADGRGPERRGPVALPRHPRGRAQPEAAEDRRHRHPLPARMGRHDAARGDARRARHPGRSRARSATPAARTTPAGTS